MMAIYYRETLPENVSLLDSGMDPLLSASNQMVGPIATSLVLKYTVFPGIAGNSHSTSGTTATVIVGITCSLVFLSIGVLLGIVSLYLIQRARGRLSGPTTGPSPLPLPPAATYEEVGVAGEVKRSHDIQLTSNEAYGHLNKNNIPTSPNTAYGQV